MLMTWSYAATPGSRPSRSRRGWPGGWSREGWRSTKPRPGSSPSLKGSISSDLTSAAIRTASCSSNRAPDDYLWKLTYKWACWTHSNKPKGWIVGRYFRKFAKFRNDRWVFGDESTGAYLPRLAWTDIVRHTLAKGRASPDDPALAGYWAQRRQKVKPPLD